jgi:hypothetical protein
MAMADPVSLAITVALNVAAFALQASRKIEGPRLNDLKASTADYGTPLVQFYGTKRLELPCIYAEDIREEKHQNKTKGGKYNEYKYFGTWAGFIADHEIAAVLQIMLDRHLVMDQTHTGGPVDSELLGLTYRIYYGTETQAPDPRLVAKIEAREGSGTCPAYLGVAYIVFEDIPLDAFGNRLPQCSVVATRTGIPLYPSEVKDVRWGTNLFAFNRTFTRFLVASEQGGADDYQLWDNRTRTIIKEGTWPCNAESNFVYNDAGDIYVLDSAFSIVTVSGDMTTASAPIPLDYPGNDIYFAGGFGCVTSLTAATYLQLYDGNGLAGVVNVGFPPASVATGPDGLPWALARSGTDILAKQVGGDERLLLIPDPPGGTDTPYGLPTSDGHMFLVRNNSIKTIDTETGDILHEAIALGSATQETITNHDGSDLIWLENNQYDMRTCSLLQTAPYSNWGVPGAASDIYDPLNRALVGKPLFSSQINWLFFRAAGGPWTLGQICADAANQAGFRTTDYDFTDLDQSVLGFAWTQGPAKQIVGPLLDLYDSDIGPHGFIQRGLKRGQPMSGDVITPEWMVRENSGDDAGSHPLYSVQMTSETDLPLRVFATFADPNMDEQPNTAVAQRNAASVLTKREQSFDFGTLSIDPDDMQPLLERALRRYWVGATRPEFILTPLEIRMEPADVRPLLLEDGELLRVRLVRLKIRANRMLDTEWELDGETPVNFLGWEADSFSPLDTIYPSPGGFTYGRDPDTIIVPVETVGLILDVALLADADDLSTPFLYAAAGPSDEGFWPGTGVWSSDFGTADSYTTLWDTFTSDQVATQGTVDGILPEALPEVMDEASVITAILPAGGTLVSVTEAELLADPTLNLVIIGSEVLQFREAEQIDTAPVKYELTGLIRGARGTEHAIAGHVDGEDFLLVNSRVIRHVMGASEIGDTDYYKFSTFGSDLDSAETHTVPFAANANRPLSPAHLALARDSGTGDWAISWIRRTRVGGSLVNGQDVPLGETSEFYRVRIMDGPSVKRTIEVTSQSATYTAAQQATDWGSGQTSLTVEVVQVSPALSLEGFEATASA